MTLSVFDPRTNELGEGPVWEPSTDALWWVDLDQAQLMMRGQDGTTRQWSLPYAASAVFRGGADTEVLLATERGLECFDTIETKLKTRVAIPDTAAHLRSNDSRADPWGGVWISMMDRGAEYGHGTIWRLFEGEARRLVNGLTIPNGIAFDRGRGLAMFADSPRHRVFRIALNSSTGWPESDPEEWINLSAEGLIPDGAVVDAVGQYWSAHWGAGLLISYGPDGRESRRLSVPALQPTCPAFGGTDCADLFLTTAATGLGERVQSENGAVLRFSGLTKGQPEPVVLL